MQHLLRTARRNTWPPSPGIGARSVQCLTVQGLLEPHTSLAALVRSRSLRLRQPRWPSLLLRVLAGAAAATVMLQPALSREGVRPGQRSTTLVARAR
mmetsp:Transcript_11539/g.24252  ORF Transcript_11539/g.24252 Transcript_11539/m.24252 type:complete len:97 (-) Transcript_11539:1200-1490(-)